MSTPEKKKKEEMTFNIFKPVPTCSEYEEKCVGDKSNIKKQQEYVDLLNHNPSGEKTRTENKTRLEELKKFCNATHCSHSQVGKVKTSKIVEDLKIANEKDLKEKQTAQDLLDNAVQYDEARNARRVYCENQAKLLYSDSGNPNESSITNMSQSSMIQICTHNPDWRAANKTDATEPKKGNSKPPPPTAPRPEKSQKAEIVNISTS